jgi:hypothetical protein
MPTLDDLRGAFTLLEQEAVGHGVTADDTTESSAGCASLDGPGEGAGKWPRSGLAWCSSLQWSPPRF